MFLNYDVKSQSWTALFAPLIFNIKKSPFAVIGFVNVTEGDVIFKALTDI